jgi:hypothetical protein
MNDTPPFFARERQSAGWAYWCAATLLLFATSQVSGAAGDARQMIENVYRQDTSRDAIVKAGFEVFDKEGRGTTKRFTYRRIGTLGDSKTLIEFSDPEDIRGVSLLSINQPGAGARQYIYTPASQRARGVAPQQRDQRFIGTDFTLEDIQERDLAAFSYRLVSDTDLIDGQKTFKVEVVPLNASNSQYKFSYYWVVQNLPVIIQAEMYDAAGEKVRVLQAAQFKRVSGIWGARRTEIRSVREGTRTVLSVYDVKFNVGLDLKQFTPEALEERGAGPTLQSGAH